MNHKLYKLLRQRVTNVICEHVNVFFFSNEKKMLGATQFTTTFKAFLFQRLMNLLKLSFLIISYN